MTYWEKEKDWFEEYCEARKFLLMLCRKFGLEEVKKNKKLYKWYKENKNK